MENELTSDEQRLLAADDRATDRVGVWLIAIIGLPAVAIAIVVVQSVIWLKTGTWPSFPIAAALKLIGLAAKPSGWIGADEIIDYLLACPVSGALTLLGIAATFAFTRNDHKDEPEALREARRKRANIKAGRRDF
jgi:hypothetical protein